MGVPTREELLLDSYLSRSGVRDGLVSAIHPADEMLLHVVRTGRSAGTEALHYLRSGHQAWQSIEHVLATAGRKAANVGSYLDFACGYGRCLRFAVLEIPPERVWAADIDAQATAHVARSFGVHGVPSCLRPEDFEIDRKFEVIFVGSLFSHLPEPTFRGWLSRLYDLLEPDGLLLFSTHGMAAFPDYADESGFRFAELNETEGRLETRDYGSTFVTPERLRSLAASCGIGVVYSLERELWYFQDLHVAMRSADARFDHWTHAPIVHGGIHELSVGDGTAKITGNANLMRTAAELKSISIEIGSAGAFGVPFREASIEGRSDDSVRHYEWSLEGPTQGLPPGRHPVCVLAEVGDAPAVAFEVGTIEIPEHG